MNIYTIKNTIIGISMEIKKEDLTLLGVKDAASALEKGVCSSQRLIESCLLKIKVKKQKKKGGARPEHGALELLKAAIGRHIYRQYHSIVSEI